MHDLLTGIIPVVGLVGTLSDTDFTVDAKFRVSVNAKLMIVFIDRLKQQVGYPLSVCCQKSRFLDKTAKSALKTFHNSGKSPIL
jgi:hypothetical protein